MIPQETFSHEFYQTIRINVISVFQTLVLLILTIGSISSDDLLIQNNPIILAPRAIHTGTIIFLHGHGQTGESYSQFMEKVRQPYMKVICPTANNRPITWQMGLKMNMPSWFNFMSDKPPIVDEYTKEIKIATKYIHYLINEEIKDGVDSDRIIIAGYGQGGTLALHAALSYNKKLGGIVTFSTWKPMDRTLDEDFRKVNINIPILMCHVSSDPFVPSDLSEKFANEMKEHVSRKVIFKRYTDVLAIVDQELEAMKIFCKEHVPPY